MTEARTEGTEGTEAVDPEDAKLAVLARSARARTKAAQAAAVRDTDGRTYVATTVHLPSLTLSALQLAVCMAVSSGALGLEAALILGEDSDSPDDAGVAALRDVAPAASLLRADPQGRILAA
jgi:hypothetical protein